MSADDHKYELISSYRGIYLELRSTVAQFAACRELSFNEFVILKYLDGNEDASLSELSKNVHGSESQCSIWIDNLAKRGLVSRTRDKEDRRRLFLCLTSEGKGLLQDVIGEKSKLVTFMNEALDLSVAEMDTMIRLNHRILEALQSRQRYAE